MTTFLVMCGTSGSGKTHVAKHLAKEFNAEYISADELRAELGHGELDHTVNRKVFWVIEEHLQCTDAEYCVVDVTNARQEDRHRLLSWCSGTSVLVWVDTPLETCIARQQLRERQVPAEAIRRMYHLLKTCPPSTRDGADMFLHLTG